MPKYRVTLLDGRVVTLEAASRPSESDVLAAIGGGAVPAQEPPASAPEKTWTDTAKGLAGAVGKGVVQGMGYAPLKAAYDQAKSVYDDPVQYLSDAGAQGGAMTGARLGASFGPLGAAIGGVGGAILGGAGGQAAENKIKARPTGEGVVGEGALQGAIQSIPIVGRGVMNVGRWGMGKAIGPPVSILNKMSEARTLTPQQLRGHLADVSYAHSIPPTGAGLLKAIGKVNANSAEQKAMEVAAGEAGRSINMRDVMRRVHKDALRYKKPGATIPSIEADTRPSAAIAATKSALTETATRNPNLSVPFEKFSDVPRAVSPDMAVRTEFPNSELFSNAEREGISRSSALLPRKSVGSIPNPQAEPSVVGDVRRGVNAKLVDAYGIDPETTAGIMVDKAWARNTAPALEDVTAGLGERGYAEVGKETHDLLSLIDAVRQRSYNSATNPVRLYEFLGALSGNPAAIGLGMASRPPVMWRAGHGLRKIGEGVGAIDPTLVRAALAALMGQQPPTQDK